MCHPDRLRDLDCRLRRLAHDAVVFLVREESRINVSNDGRGRELLACRADLSYVEGGMVGIVVSNNKLNSRTLRLWHGG